MAAIILPERRSLSEQPPELLELDLSNPLAEGISSLMLHGWIIRPSGISAPEAGSSPRGVDQFTSNGRALQIGTGASNAGYVLRLGDIGPSVSTSYLDLKETRLAIVQRRTAINFAISYNLPGGTTGGLRWRMGSNGQHQLSLPGVTTLGDGRIMAIGETAVIAVRAGYVSGSFANGDAFTNGIFDSTGIYNGTVPGGVGSIGGTSPATDPMREYGAMPIHVSWQRWQSNAAIEEASSNPWQLLRRKVRRIYFIPSSAGAVQDLSASAQAQAAATAALSVSKPLGAAGAAQATATAALLKGVSLSAAGLAVASGNASVSHTVPLQASAAAIAVAGAQMALAVTLSATGLATAAGTAALTVGSATGLVADGQAQASASAVLSLSVQLSGAAVSQAQASASLAVGKTLAASGAAQAAGTAALQVGSGALLAAAGTAQASAGATLQLMVPISAAALAQALATGSLLLTVPLSAAAFAQSSSSAEFAGDVQMSAQGVAMASATATLLVTGPYASAPEGSRFYRSPSSFRPARTQAGGRPASSSTSRPSR